MGWAAEANGYTGSMVCYKGGEIYDAPSDLTLHAVWKCNRRENTSGTCDRCGGDGKLSDSRRVTCPTCSGEGGTPVFCFDCAGSGKIQYQWVDYPDAKIELTCPTCSGRGNLQNVKISCNKCAGKGSVSAPTTYCTKCEGRGRIDGSIIISEYYYCEPYGSRKVTEDYAQFHKCFKEVSLTRATCTAAGKQVNQCNWCGQTKTLVSPALGHTYVKLTVDPTCLSEGFTVHKCVLCGNSYQDSRKEALGHNWIESPDGKKATCTENGVKIYICKNDASHVRKESIPALGHHCVIDRASDPTCETAGATEGSHCATCGEILATQCSIPALGHHYSVALKIQPTYDSPGLEKQICDRCGKSNAKPIPKLVKSTSNITISNQTQVYSGRTIGYTGRISRNGSAGKITYKYYQDSQCTKPLQRVTDAGIYYVRATVVEDMRHKSATSSPAKLVVTKAANTLKAKAKPTTIKFNTLKKKKRVVSPITATEAQGSLSYKVAKWTSKKAKKYIGVNKATGKITVKKGTPKGTYKFKVKVTARGNKNYFSASKTVSITIKIK